MKKVLFGVVLFSSIAFAEDASPPLKMAEIDYLKLQVIELQSRLEEANQRAFTCERARAEEDRNKQRAEIAKVYKIDPADRIGAGGVIVRKDAKKPAKK